MKHLKLAQKNKEVAPESWNALYKTTVVRKLRKEHKVDIYEELKVHRETIVLLANIVKSLHGKEIDLTELEKLNQIVEQCKADTKAELSEI